MYIHIQDLGAAHGGSFWGEERRGGGCVGVLLRASFGGFPTHLESDIVGRDLELEVRLRVARAPGDEHLHDLVVVDVAVGRVRRVVEEARLVVREEVDAQRAVVVARLDRRLRERDPVRARQVVGEAALARARRDVERRERCVGGAGGPGPGRADGGRESGGEGGFYEHFFLLFFSSFAVHVSVWILEAGRVKPIGDVSDRGTCTTKICAYLYSYTPG